MDTNNSKVLFDAISDSAMLVDKSGRIVDWNSSATSMFGYHKKEALGKSINMIYQQNQPFAKIIQKILPEEKKWSTESRYIRKNGIKGYCLTNVSKINLGDDSKACALVIVRSITSIKEQEKEFQEKNKNLSHELNGQLENYSLASRQLIQTLISKDSLELKFRESELRFLLFAENATDMISRHSPDGAFVYTSPSSKALLGFKPEELLHHKIYKYVHFDDVGKVKKAFNRRREKSNYITISYRVRRKEGDYRWFESNIRHIFDEKTRVIREIQAASRDITARVQDKKARLRGQQLAHVSRLSSMEEMASGMAHEICQPLAAIVNYTQGCVRYLEANKQDPQQLMEIMKKAVAQAERAGEVIQRLKNFFCKGQLLKTPCKINSLIRETVSLSRSDLSASKVKIDFELAKDIQAISADKIQLQQVLLNLIQNAIDAMQENDPKNRRIYIKSNNIDEHAIEITFQDTGPGFSKESIAKVFEPFFTTKAHGRGMGLAICRSIIEAHGGQFIIKPNTQNKSSIGFSLPIN